MKGKPAATTVVYVVIGICLVIATARITWQIARHGEGPRDDTPRGLVPTERFPAGEGWEDVSPQEDIAFRGGIEAVLAGWRQALRADDAAAAVDARALLLAYAGQPPTRLAVVYARELALPGEPSLADELAAMLRGLAEPDALSWAGAMAAAATDLEDARDPTTAVGGYLDFVVDVLVDDEAAFEPFVATYLGVVGETSDVLRLATLDAIGRLHAAEFSPAVVRLLQGSGSSRAVRERAWSVLVALDTAGEPPDALLDRIADLPGPVRKTRALRSLAWLPDLASAWAGIERVLARNEDLGAAALHAALEELALARAERIHAELAVLTAGPEFWRGIDVARHGQEAVRFTERHRRDPRHPNTRVGLANVAFHGGAGTSPAGSVHVQALRAALVWTVTAADADRYLETLDALAARNDREGAVLATVLLQHSGRMRTRVRERNAREAFDERVLGFCARALGSGSDDAAASGLAGLRWLATPHAARRLREIAADSEHPAWVRQLAKAYHRALRRSPEDAETK